MFKFICKSLLLCAISNIYATQINISVTDSNGFPLNDIIVSVTPETIIQTQTQPAIKITQQNKKFSPYLNVIQKGQNVTFVNNDDITHQIFSASRKQSFSFRIRKGMENSSVEFNQLGSISMGCNIHDWMSGHLLILDTPYFKKTNSDGNVQFSLSETGTASVNIWHPQLNEKSHELGKEIQLSGKSVEVIFSLKKHLSEIPDQETDDDFDFLDDY